jgi:maleamate amidohydrolase
MDFSKIIPPEDLKVFEKGRHGQRMGFGKKPCLLLVDMTYAFVDPGYALCSGESPGQAVTESKALLAAARKKGLPVIYTRGVSDSVNPADWGSSRKRMVNREFKRDKANAIVESITPLPGEIVIEKPKASAFFGTNLLGTLIFHQVDTVIVTGVSTSGCVRASVVDAASYNYYVIVPEECVGDRAALSHRINLFDMHMKYADVLPKSEVINYIETLP